MRGKLPVKWHGLIDCETQPMSEGLSEVFIRCSLAESIPQPPGMDEALAKHFTYQVMNKRLEMVHRADDAHVSLPVKMLVSCLCDSPGKAVMWAYTLNYISISEGRRLDVGVLADWFPNGFPTEDALAKAWDSQKWSAIDPSVKKDNWLDDLDNWPRRDERALSN